MALRTRKPTGEVPFPLVLLEGGEKTGKTYAALEFSGDERVGRVWVMDLAEGSMDEYGAIPGADFELIEHDGTWRDIVGQLEAAKAEAEADRDAGKPPAMLVVDTMTAEWDMLRAWVDTRARRAPGNARKLREDPDADIVMGRQLWNAADKRHAAFMLLLFTFPGIVVVTSRGKEISATGKDGQPIPGEKDYRVEAHKNLGYDATAWVRMSRKEPPTVVGLRSVRHGIRPGIDEVKPWIDFTLAALVFDVIGCKTTSAVRAMPQLDADQVMPDEETSPEAGEGAQAEPRSAEKPATALLRAASLDRVKWFKGKVDDNGDSGLDATPFVTQDDREALGDRLSDGKVTLGQLAAAVVGYWEKHGRGPRDETPATEAPAEPAETATSGEEAAPAPS